MENSNTAIKGQGRGAAKEETLLRGIPGSPGICVGQAHLLDRGLSGAVRKYSLAQEQVQGEVNRFKQAVKRAEMELVRLVKQAPEELRAQTYIFEAHSALLRDKSFYGKIIETILAERVNVEWALKKTVDQITRVFSKIEDEYLRERAADVGHVQEMVLRALLGAENERLGGIAKRSILVAGDLSPAETSQLQLDHVMGIALDRGGRASHTTIIARTLQVPAVMGLGEATRLVRDDDLLILDGTRGLLILNPREETLERYGLLKHRFEAAQARMAREGRLPALTRDGLAVSIKGNIEVLEDVVQVMDRGGDGIGLYRTEFLYMRRDSLPTEEELYDNYKQILELIAPMPVTIRTLDLGGDKVAHGIRASGAENPALGLRAIRLCLMEPEILKTQLAAIYRAAVHGNARILYPMISGLEELDQIDRVSLEVQERLSKENIPYNAQIETGIMVEVPSAAVLADLFAERVRFFSLGTNDLVQYTLAVDRNDQEVAHLFQHLHPAVARLLKNVADAGKAAGIGLAMCGEMAGDPQCVPLLLGLGYFDLSMNPQMIPVVKSMVREMDLPGCEAIAQDILRLKTSFEIQRYIKEALGDVLERVFPNGGNGGPDNGDGNVKP